MLLSELAVVRAAHIVLACDSAHRASVLNGPAAMRVRHVSPCVMAKAPNVVEAATQNALEVFSRSSAPYQKVHGRQPSLIVGVDTVITAGDHAFGKPKNLAEARDMLTELASAGTHKVVTGVALVYGDPNGGDTPAHVQTFVEETTVELSAHAMGAAEIEAYLASGEPLESFAGGYRAGGLGAAFASGVHGDHLNAEYGFPLNHFLAEVDCGRLKAWIDAAPEERPPAAAEAAADDEAFPGIVCEDDEECGVPSD